jgi:hypothetical protein
MTLPITKLLYSDFMLGIPPTLYASRQIWFLLQARGLAQRFVVKQGQQRSPIMLDNYPVDACAGKGGTLLVAKVMAKAAEPGRGKVRTGVRRRRAEHRPKPGF